MRQWLNTARVPPYHADELDELQPHGDDDGVPMVLHGPHHLVVVTEQVLHQAGLILIAQGQPSCRAVRKDNNSQKGQGTGSSTIGLRLAWRECCQASCWWGMTPSPPCENGLQPGDEQMQIGKIMNITLNIRSFPAWNCANMQYLWAGKHRHCPVSGVLNVAFSTLNSTDLLWHWH